MNIATPGECESQTGSEVQRCYKQVGPSNEGQVDVGLLTGGFDKPYAYGLSMALSSKGVSLDIIGSD